MKGQIFAVNQHLFEKEAGWHFFQFFFGREEDEIEKGYDTSRFCLRFEGGR